MEKIKKQKKVRIPLIIASVFFAIYGISLVIPLAWGFIMSLKVPDEYFDDLLSFPKVPQFKNYIQAFVELENGGNNLFAMIWNSLCNVVLLTVHKVAEHLVSVLLEHLDVLKEVAVCDVGIDIGIVSIT